ncbi:hypothetical protein LCGC14_0896630 [marine sediment metagenome]|uniref:Uncharacterized protein n=1 Tax=marine sediment metagenome TaxID=412755 RepID=A0A0F9NXV5_9ZZZZ
MEGETKFHVIPIDGTLVDIRRTFVELGSSLLRRPLRYAVAPEPPHTLGRLSVAAGLDERDARRIRRLIELEIVDFWLTVPATETGAMLLALPPNGPGPPTIFYAKRVKTRGNSVLLQTIAWLERHGFHSPIVWCEEE